VGAALLQIGLGGYERLFWLLAAVLVVAGFGVAAIKAERPR
jgi:hypothetical protein